jgi:DNA polymerase-3 subunit beta
MRFTSNSSELQRTLTKLGGVIPTRSTMPILENLLFELANNTLTITATDMVISSSISVQVRGEEDGRIAIPAKRLMDTIRSLPDTDAIFDIDTTSNRIKISAGRGEYTLTGENAREYPKAPTFKESASFTIDAAALRRLIYQTSFAVSADELRPAMMGILLQASEGELRAVATDGHRLSRIGVRRGKEMQLSKDVIVPAKAMNILSKAIDSGDCTLSVSDTYVRFTYENSVLLSRLIDESYPNYESVIPRDNNRVVVVRREELIGSIRRVGLYASIATHQVKLEMRPGTLAISAQDVDFGGEANETMECTYDGEEFAIGFNAHYLVDILSHLDTADVEMRFSTPTRAGLLAPVGASETEDVVMLIMPVRLNS